MSEQIEQNKAERGREIPLFPSLADKPISYLHRVLVGSKPEFKPQVSDRLRKGAGYLKSGFNDSEECSPAEGPFFVEARVGELLEDRNRGHHTDTRVVPHGIELLRIREDLSIYPAHQAGISS